MEEKNGIFISHITEERATALLLKDVLQQTFSRDLRIFVSSDYESISGGDVWFKTVVDGLKRSSVVIVLLSPDSLDRRWINFEAGVGVGAEATVIPVVMHDLDRDDVGHPLTSLQIRSLYSVKGVHVLMDDIGRKIGCIPKVFINVDALVSLANQRMTGSGWIGVEWQGRFLAVDGPMLKLQLIEDQAIEEAMAGALRSGGFTPYKSAMVNIASSLSKGYKIVYVTDRKTFRARLTSYDVVLVAKTDERQAATI
jgi:hypothetical protein